MFDINKIVLEIDQLFNNLNIEISKVADIITQPQSAMPGLWNMIEGIFNCLLPIGYSLLALFFMLDFLNKTVTFRIAKIENIIKILIRMVLAKVVMQSSFEILGLIYQSISDLISLVYNSPDTIQNIVDIAELKTQLEGMKLMELIMFQVNFMPIKLIMNFLLILIKVICYGRIIELYVFTALAPLPLSTMANEEYNNVAKRFFQHYISICLQGLIIMIACMSFSGIANTILVSTANSSAELGMWGTISSCLVLLLVITQSKNWAKQIVGVN